MTLEAQFAEHEQKDAERFVALENSIDDLKKQVLKLATSEEITALRGDIAPVVDALNWFTKLRTFSIWFAPVGKFLGVVLTLGALLYLAFKK